MVALWFYVPGNFWHGSNASGGEIISSFGFDLWSHNNFLPKNQFMIAQSDQFMNKGLKELPVVSCGDCNWGLQYFYLKTYAFCNHVLLKDIYLFDTH